MSFKRDLRFGETAEKQFKLMMQDAGYEQIYTIQQARRIAKKNGRMIPKTSDWDLFGVSPLNKRYFFEVKSDKHAHYTGNFYIELCKDYKWNPLKKSGFCASLATHFVLHDAENDEFYCIPVQVIKDLLKRDWDKTSRFRTNELRGDTKAFGYLLRVKEVEQHKIEL